MAREKGFHGPLSNYLQFLGNIGFFNNFFFQIFSTATFWVNSFVNFAFNFLSYLLFILILILICRLSFG